MPNDYVILTQQQRHFLEKYLKCPKSGKAPKKKQLEANSVVRADFMTYLAAEATVIKLLERLKRKGADVTDLEAGLAHAQQQKETSKKPDLGQLAALASRLRSDAMELDRRFSGKNDIILEAQALMVPPPGANAEHAKALADIYRAIETVLVGDPPAQEALFAALPLVNDLTTKRNQIIAEAAQRMRLLEGLEERYATSAAQMAVIETQLDTLNGSKMPDLGAQLNPIRIALGDLRTALDSNTPDIDAARDLTIAVETQLREAKLLLDLLGDAFKEEISTTVASLNLDVETTKHLNDLAEANPEAAVVAITILPNLLAACPNGFSADQMQRLQEAADRLQSETTASGEAYEATDNLYKSMLSFGVAPGGQRGNRRRGMAAIPTEITAEQEEQARASNPELQTLFDNRERLRAAHELNQQNLQIATNNSDAVRNVANLFDAVASGPFTKGHPRAFDASTGATLLALFDEDPKLAQTCIETAANAANPASVAKCGTVVIAAQKRNDGDLTKSAEFPSDAYAQNLIAVSGNYSPHMMDTLELYLGNGRMAAPLDLGGADPGNAEDIRQARTEHVQELFLQGPSGLDFRAANSAIDDIAFHPSSLDPAVPVQVNHMRETVKFFAGSQSARQTLQDVKAPAPGIPSTALVTRSKKGGGPITDKDTKSAVMNAMLTPIYQGKVGSCFATSSVLRLRQTRPEETLETLCTLATDGIYTPKRGDPVPAVNNPNVDGDPLIRSLEFTTATATARADGSGAKDSLLAKHCDVFGQLPSSLTSLDGNPDKRLQAKLSEALNAAFDIVYDAEWSMTSTSEDGRSELGAYILKSASSGARISPDTAAPDQVAQAEADAQARYWNEIRPIIEQVLRDEGRDIEDGQVESMKDYIMSHVAKGTPPWQPSAGGQTGEAAAVIFGMKNLKTELTGEIKRDEVTEDRSEEIMNALMGSFMEARDQGDDLIVMRTVGQHGFIGMPTHPSLKPLMANGPEGVADLLRDTIANEGARLKDEKLPVKTLTKMMKQDVEKLAPGNASFLADVMVNAPTEPMTASEYSEMLALAISLAGRDILSAPPEQIERICKNAAESSIIGSMEIDPQYVIADSNWGSEADHTFFVMAPSPLTGKLQLYKRTDPPGTLEVLGLDQSADWLRREWAILR